jgi:hypothetical protein
MTTVVVLQPGYLPWLGFFDQMRRCDIFVYYDDVQFDKNGWRNRNRIKTAQGPLWLTVPVRQAGRAGQRIDEVEIECDHPWGAKHLRRRLFSRFITPSSKRCCSAIGGCWSIWIWRRSS